MRDFFHGLIALPLLPSRRNHGAERRHRPWWKSFRTTAAIGYSIRHYTAPRNRMVIERAGIRTGDRVVDIGCGPGESALLAAGSAPDVQVVAVDPASPCCLTASVRALGSGLPVRVRRASAERLPVEAGWANLVLSINAFHHWADPERGLSEVRRVLAPGGRLILVDEDFPEDHEHTRFHREAHAAASVHAGSAEVRGWLTGLGFGTPELERVEDAEGAPHHLLRAALRPAASAGARGTFSTACKGR